MSPRPPYQWFVVKPCYGISVWRFVGQHRKQSQCSRNWRNSIWEYGSPC
jgi:hypothetical protein